MSIISKYSNLKNPGSFSGISGFIKNNPKFKLNEVAKELSNSEAYTKHKLTNKSFRRSKTYVPYIDNTWQIDLVDVSNLKNKKLSQFYSFLFVCIDVFSKYAYVIPMKNKSADESTRALQKILNNSGRKPENIYSDNGKEFLGSFQKLLFKLKIKQLFTKSIYKAAVVERFNRTLKERMYRVFSFQKTKNYVQILDDLVDSYNNSYHSSIKMNPIQVNLKNQDEVHNNLYDDEKLFKAKIKFKYKIGDYVRIPVKKNLFDKGYTANWSDEIYIINSFIITDPPKYNLISLDETIIENKFYTEELQKVSFNEFPYDSIRVIDTKKDKILVKKLNTENQKEVWVDKDDYIKDSINTDRITRSRTKIKHLI